MGGSDWARSFGPPLSDTSVSGINAVLATVTTTHVRAGSPRGVKRLVARRVEDRRHSLAR